MSQYKKRGKQYKRTDNRYKIQNPEVPPDYKGFQRKEEKCTYKEISKEIVY